MIQAQVDRAAAAACIAQLEDTILLLSVKSEETPNTGQERYKFSLPQKPSPTGLDSGTPFGRAHAYLHAQKNGVQPLHAALERRAEAARPSPHTARHSPLWKGVQRLHTLPRTLHAIHTPSIRRAYGVQACDPARQVCRACTPVWRACKA
ncbi:hypothetical protein PCANC_05869 [Puccinia coronata f. sp. avenae]|uniref:Uncharacterized protein n=1 Tax=Puccinia coronata f. sp. avenae TaxID=200324 RepID=A0A2N5VBQ0_9BASI|nr:hypothetical protein PCANC_05869 [Puccinia coronata f. sp. avenae]